MVGDVSQAETAIPLSESITPRTPSSADKDPRSEAYTEARLTSDYELFMKDQEGYDPNKPLSQKQRELFKLYEKGEVDEPIQAWEWMLGRKWEEFDAEERALVLKNLSPEERSQFGHLLDPSIKFVPKEDDLRVEKV